MLRMREKIRDMEGRMNRKRGWDGKEGRREIRRE